MTDNNDSGSMPSPRPNQKRNMFCGPFALAYFISCSASVAAKRIRAQPSWTGRRAVLSCSMTNMRDVLLDQGYRAQLVIYGTASLPFATWLQTTEAQTFRGIARLNTAAGGHFIVVDNGKWCHNQDNRVRKLDDLISKAWADVLVTHLIHIPH